MSNRRSGPDSDTDTGQGQGQSQGGEPPGWMAEFDRTGLISALESVIEDLKDPNTIVRSADVSHAENERYFRVDDSVVIIHPDTISGSVSVQYETPAPQDGPVAEEVTNVTSEGDERIVARESLADIGTGVPNRDGRDGSDSDDRGGGE